MSNYFTSGEIRQRSTSDVPVLKTAPYVDIVGIRCTLNNRDSDVGLSVDLMIAAEHALFHTQMEYLSREYEYGGIIKTLLEYENDWFFTQQCLIDSKRVFDLIHPRKTKEGYTASDDAVIKSIRVKCRELGDIRGLILQHMQRCWSNKGKKNGK